jgi:hypothetical protein
MFRRNRAVTRVFEHDYSKQLIAGVHEFPENRGQSTVFEQCFAEIVL